MGIPSFFLWYRLLRYWLLRYRRVHPHALILGIILVGLCLARQVCAQTLHTDQQISPQAALITLNQQGWLFDIAEEGRRAVEARQVVRWGSWPGLRREQGVWLSDGSWICGELTLGARGEVTVDSQWLKCPRISGAAVRGLVLNPPASLSQWLELQAQMLAASGEQDLLWLTSGRRLAGVLRWSSEQQQPQPKVTLEAGEKTIHIDLDDVRAIVLSPTLVGRLPEKRGLTVGLRDGSRLHVRKLGIADDKVRLILQAALQLNSHDSAEQFAMAIRYLDGTPKNTVYLSNLEVAQYRHVPDGLVPWELGVDQDVLGRPLVLSEGLAGEGLAGRGLAMHSASQVAFRWDGSAGRLLAEVVFAMPQDGAQRELGSVDCRILLARNGKLEQADRFPLSRSGQSGMPSKLVEIDVTGAGLVVLVTEQADFGQLGDHVLWLDARVARDP